MLPSDLHETPTLRQQIDSLPAHVAKTWRSRYANEGQKAQRRENVR